MSTGEKKIFQQVEEMVNELAETSQRALFEHWKNEALAKRVKPHYALEVYRRKVDDDTDQVLVVLRASNKTEIEGTVLFDDISNFLIEFMAQQLKGDNHG